MPCKIVLFQAARLDFHEAESWYLQNSKAAAKCFVRQYLKLIQSIADNPFQYPMIHGEVRSARFGKSFPSHAVLFFLLEDTAYIVAIFHDKRNPESWQLRID